MPQLQPILLVEDSPEDYEATLRAFKKSRVANPVVRCEDGDEAIDYLFHRGQFAEPGAAPRPGLVLLDLNLARVDGREVLARVKADKSLRTIPVVVLTTSADDRDIQRCYEAGANSYVKKPVDFFGFIEAISRLEEYWLGLVVLPSGRR